MTVSETERFSQALAFAAQKHSSQRRKDDSPYILHPIRVAMELFRQGYDVRYQIAGLFHDLLEDTDATEAELKEFCDEEMMNAVRLVTKTDGYTREKYFADILANPMAKAVKCADRIDNLRDLEHQDSASFTEKYMKETREWFYGKFSEELDKVFEQLEKST